MCDAYKIQAKKPSHWLNMFSVHVNGFQSLQLDAYWKPYPNDDYLMPIRRIDEIPDKNNNDLGYDVLYILHLDYGEYIALNVTSSVFDIVYHDEFTWGFLDEMKIEETASIFKITFDNEDETPLEFVFMEAEPAFKNFPKVEDIDE